MENKTSCYLAIAALIFYVLPYFLSPLAFNLEKEDVSRLFTAMAVLEGISVILIIAAIITHKHKEDTGWRSSTGRICAVYACCLAPFTGILLLLFLLVLRAMIGFDIKSEILYVASVIIVATAGVFIAVSGIRNYELKGRTLALIVLLPAILGTGYTVLGAIFIPTDSCGPSVYSFNGEEYVFDCEPYAGAILAERTCYSELKELDAKGSQYRIKIANELEETQYTDELKLLVIEHPAGSDVVCDYPGGIYTISSAVEPISAVEGGDIDILEKVSKKDDLFWEGDSSGGVRAELVLEFAKPAGARAGKLVMNVSNSHWGTGLSARFLRSLGAWYPVMIAMRSYARKGFIRFDVQARDNERWVSMGHIRGANPEMPKDQVIVMNLSEIAGDYLKLRLLPASGFWRINSAVVDYSDDTEAGVVELSASMATSHDGKDVREALRANDGNMYILEKGESATIVFEAPALSLGTNRSFILKAAGYYVVN